MTEKLKVSREVANAIEYIGKVECDFEEVMELHVSKEWINFSDERVIALCGLTSRELATALIVGYEVEKTPAEIIKAEYQKAADERKKSEDDYRIQYLGGYQYGVQETLRVLELIVEGVNDNETI